MRDMGPDDEGLGNQSRQNPTLAVTRLVSEHGICQTIRPLTSRR